MSLSSISSLSSLGLVTPNTPPYSHRLFTTSPDAHDAEKETGHHSADTTLSDPCLTNLEPLSSPPIPTKVTPPSTSPVSESASHSDSSFHPNAFSFQSAFIEKPPSITSVRVKRHRLKEVYQPSSSTFPCQGSNSNDNHSESNKCTPFPIKRSKPPFSSHDAPTSAIFSTQSHAASRPSDLHSSLNNDQADHFFSSSPSSLSPFTPPLSLETSFSSDVSDFSTIHSDLEDLEEDALIKALNHKLSTSALEMFVSLRQKDQEASNSSNPSPPPLPRPSLSPTVSSPSTNNRTDKTSFNPPSQSEEWTPSSDLPISPLSIMGVPQLNHLAKVYGLLFDLHSLHLNPVSIYSLSSTSGSWLSLTTLPDYHANVRIQLPHGLGMCSFVIPFRQPQRQRAELNTLRILCPQQETIPLQCNATILHAFMTQSCHISFHLESKPKGIARYSTSVQKNQKSVIVKAESQLRLLPLLKSSNLQYLCEVPFFMENSKFLGYLDMSLKLLPLFRESSLPNETSTHNASTSSIDANKEAINKREENNSEMTLNELNPTDTSPAFPPHFLSHPAFTLPLEFSVSISDLIPIVPPDTARWPLSLASSPSSTAATGSPTTLKDSNASLSVSYFQLSLKCPVTLESSPIPCVFVKNPFKGCSIDLNTLFSLPITLRQLSPWLNLPLILEIKYQIYHSFLLLGLVKLPLPHLLETFLLSGQAWESILPLSMQSECPIVEPLSGILQGYVCVSLQLTKHHPSSPTIPDTKLIPQDGLTDYVPISIRIKGTGGFLSLAKMALQKENLASQRVLYKAQLHLFPEHLSDYTSHFFIQTPWKSGLPQYQLQQTILIRALEPTVLRYLEEGIAKCQVLCALEESHIIGTFELPLHLLLRRSSGINGWIPVQSVHGDGFGCLQLEMFFKDTEKKMVPSNLTEEVIISIFIQDLSDYSFSLDTSVLGILHAPLEKKGRMHCWKGCIEVTSESLVSILNGQLYIHVHDTSSEFQGICFIDTFDVAQKLRAGIPGRILFRNEVLRIHDPEVSTLFVSGYIQMEPKERNSKSTSLALHSPSESSENYKSEKTSYHQHRKNSFRANSPFDIERSSVSNPSSPSSSFPSEYVCKHSKTAAVSKATSNLHFCIQMLRFRKEINLNSPLQFSIPWNEMIFHTSVQTLNPMQLLTLPLESIELLQETFLDVQMTHPSFGKGKIEVDISVLSKGWSKICGWYHIYCISNKGLHLGQALLEIYHQPPLTDKHQSKVSWLDMKQALPQTLENTCLNSLNQSSFSPSSPVPGSLQNTTVVIDQSNVTQSPSLHSLILSSTPDCSETNISVTPQYFSSSTETDESEHSELESHHFCKNKSNEDTFSEIENENLNLKKNESQTFVSVQGLRERAAAIEREIQMALRQYAFMESISP